MEPLLVSEWTLILSFKGSRAVLFLCLKWQVYSRGGCLEMGILEK